MYRNLTLSYRQLVKAAALLCLIALLLPIQAAALPPSNSLEALVNRQHPLQPRNYGPVDLTVPTTLLGGATSESELQLRKPAALALNTMFVAAQKANIILVLSSGYRSYDDQAALYTQLVSQQGSVAFSEVAPAGTSEQQTGLAADIILSSYFCAAQGCFALSRAAAWLDTHSYQYGFVVRYMDYKQSITGYEYEPWHFRYLGILLATKLHRSAQTLEEYYTSRAST